MLLKITELNEQAKNLIEATFSQISIIGEISQITKQQGSGHWYFTLKDETSSIKCAMWKFLNSRVNFDPKIGTKIIATGKVTIYSKDGTYQFIANSLKLQGEGELEAKFNALKEKLFNEGLFDKRFKKPLPKFPKKIAIITSITGAVLQDMKRSANERYKICQFFIYDSLVQGQNAPQNLIKALKAADLGGYDAIILARGGGSKEDLWCFNDENLAREIFAAKTPIISAIGHEIDFSISDFVSDHTSHTPTAAIEDLLPKSSEILEKLRFYQMDLDRKTFQKIENHRKILKDFERIIKFSKIGNKIDESKKILQNKKEILLKNLQNIFKQKQNQLHQKMLILEQKNLFFQKSKNLINIKFQGKITNLQNLKIGDEIILSSQNLEKLATIKGDL